MTTEAAAEPRIHQLLLDLFAVFGERDPERRLEAIARNYTEDVSWTDPDGTTDGHEALNEGAHKLLDRMPSFVLSAAGPVHVSRDLGLLGFNLGVPKQPRAVSGIDVALVRDRRIACSDALLNAEG